MYNLRRQHCLAAFVSVLFLLGGASASSRKLTQKDGILPTNFNDVMDAILPTSPYTLTPNASPATCQKFLDAAKESCKTGLSAQTATYGKDRKFEVTICTCAGGPYDTKALADLVARLPEFLLFWVKGVTSVASKSSGAAAQTFTDAGQIQVFTKIRARSLVHEAGHAQDRAFGYRDTAFTTTDAWKKAVQSSSCKATAYSGTPGVGIGEEYAEDIMIFTYNLYRGNYAAFDTRCLDPELKALSAYTDSLSKSG